MSHAFESDIVDFKSLTLLIAAFKELGWEVTAAGRIRTYPGDPAEKIVFDRVAVNPHTAYDVGITAPKNAKDHCRLKADFEYGRLSEHLGKKYSRLQHAYGVKLAESAVTRTRGKVVSRSVAKTKTGTQTKMVLRIYV